MKLQNKFLLFSLIMVVSSITYASEGIEEELDSDKYQNPFDKISDENKTEITDWLSLQTEINLEKEGFREDYANTLTENTKEPATFSISLELEAELSENIFANVSIESEHQNNQTHSGMDEYELNFVMEPLDISIGRFSLPVAHLQSKFLTDPFINFVDTRADALLTKFHFSDSLKLNFMIFNSQTEAIKTPDKFDYAFSINWTSPDERFQTGLGYLSDLSESDVSFLSDYGDLYQNRVDAMNVYLTYAWLDFEISIETVKALRDFKELDEKINQPVASNLEIAWFTRPDLLLAIRYESSDELEEAAKTQHGIAIAYRPFQHVIIALDYLQARYESGFIEDENENELKHSNTIATQLTIQF